jgi:hypothetical protein
VIQTKETKDFDIMGEDWRYLIVLDACRYDYFLAAYRFFFDGTLHKIYSKGSCTYEWIVNNFVDKYKDIIYVSANPHVNSKFKVKGFNARERFYRVIDVWDFGWESDLGTVPPWNLNSTVIELLSKYPRKRFIIHYLQPHPPYISPRYRTLSFRRHKLGSLHMHIYGGRQSNVKNLDKLFRKASRVLPNTIVWKVRGVFRLPPISPIDTVVRAYGIEGLRKAYLENLLIALQHVAPLVNILLRYGKVVITSDHGEYLGEKLSFSHPCGKADSILREVPWLHVKTVKKEFKKYLDEAANRKYQLRSKIRKIIKLTEGG